MQTPRGEGVSEDDQQRQQAASFPIEMNVG
jgi:hypothetical protein